MSSAASADNDRNQEPARVSIDPQVVFTRREIGGRDTFVAHHAATGKFFQFGAEEYRVASLLDGSRSLSEIIPILHRDGVNWEPKEVAEFISKLVASRLAGTVDSVGGPSQGDKNPGTAPQPVTTWSQRLPRLLSLMVSQRIPLVEGHAIASKLEKRFGILFSGVGTLAWCLLVFSSLLIVAANRQAFAAELGRMFDPGIWIVLLVMWAVAKVIHEAGHAIAARYHGVHVGKIGIMFFFLAPLAYVDVTDAWKLRSRWSRVQIALAGVYLELAVAALAAWSWWFLPDGLPRHLAAQFFLVAGPATLLVNANPLLRLDGYYVVSDLTEIPNLRMHGRTQLAGYLEKILLKLEPQRALLSGWRRTFAGVHAACSVLFQIVWMSGLIIGVTIWAKGLGMLLALAAALLWAILPLSRWVYKVWTLEPATGRWYMNEKRKRLLYIGFVLVLALQYLFASDSPLARRVPVVVQYRDPQVARASSDAFVQAVYVAHGQRVKQGMLLLELNDPELLIRRHEKDSELKIAKLRAIQFRRQGDLSQSAAETENAESLGRQLAELDGQVDGLMVFAERDGLVLSPKIDNLEGRFVNRGEEILRVSDPQEKELLAAVGEPDMQAYQAATSRGVPTEVRLRGGTCFSTIPASLRPRARRDLPHPALAATVGGPLPVEASPDEDGKMRVIQPQLESLTPLDPVTSVELHAGQIGMMTISDNRSLIARLWDHMVSRSSR